MMHYDTGILAEPVQSVLLTILVTCGLGRNIKNFLF
jgi:hypothetical protein